MRRLFLLLAACAAFPLQAQTVPAGASFDEWLAAFRQEAVEKGISPATLDSALTGMMPIERVVELDTRQPEFQQTFADYIARRVTEKRVAQGIQLAQDHAALLDAVERKYGIPRSVLLAFWGLETNYGSFLGNLNIPAALATLAYDGRRSQFFRSQLLDALRIIDDGHVLAVDMKGSWAGAMGQMQFMPGTFRAYAIDGDGDGRIDVWQSLPDAMYSAANYLQQAGWRANEPVALTLRLPENFDFAQASVDNRLPVTEWQARGVLQADGTFLPTTGSRAAIVLPQGWLGPAFMVFDNFDVVMRWNRSVNYALSVAQLANQIAGASPLPAWMGDATVLSIAELKALQHSLNELGYNAGTPDGLVGPRTQQAIRMYQVVHNLPADGYPSPSVLAHVGQRYAAAIAADQAPRGDEWVAPNTDDRP
ncbi:MAG: lytic murein transglycosylase [Thiobacillus sp.]|nr:lytic murein transglycosylase [Thiobacillus sp.]